MLTIYSDDHHLHHGAAELIDGTFKPCFEMPSRADMVLARAKAVKLGPIAAPRDFGLDPVRRVHSEGFVRFLQNAWSDWTALGRSHDMLPMTWPVRRLRDVEPDTIDGKLGYYSFDAGAPITAGTWKAITASANVALTGQAELAKGARGVFSLCRPPGHHAAADYIGGYCYLNNAAIAAQAMLDQGASRVAILDVDYHHGNGTQDIFYDRGDVLFTSIHGDPRFEYPYFLGFADEKGVGVGRRLQLQLPAGRRQRLVGVEPGAGRRLPADRRLRRRRAGGVAGRGHLQGRPDLPVQAGQPGLHAHGRNHRPAWACRPCSSWKAA